MNEPCWFVKYEAQLKKPTHSGRFFCLPRSVQIKGDPKSTDKKKPQETWLLELILLVPWLFIVVGLFTEAFPLFPIGLFSLLPTGLLVTCIQIFKTRKSANQPTAGMSRGQLQTIASANLLIGILGWMLIYVVTA